ncbi:hypothetical protein [Rhodopirellula halodulae]|uniref:hypothetical protein n=1 Tax=Rhodopirellula halodulae TaxID=2894198 RepID=UPI001E2D7318|nr:hypothetical protein [Rhodopirellula sp. JC737]MCC9658263.1 hypothetical protein [Rhodopirellula sp. JC737]
MFPFADSYQNALAVMLPKSVRWSAKQLLWGMLLLVCVGQGFLSAQSYERRGHDCQVVTLDSADTTLPNQWVSGRTAFAPWALQRERWEPSSLDASPALQCAHRGLIGQCADRNPDDASVRGPSHPTLVSTQVRLQI